MDSTSAIPADSAGQPVRSDADGAGQPVRSDADSAAPYAGTAARLVHNSHSDSARRSDLTTDPNSWLMDDRLDSARVAISKTYMELSQMGASPERLSTELEVRLAHLQKEGATVLGEKLGLEDTAGQMGGSSDNATDRT